MQDPDTIGRSYTDTDTNADTGNDVTYSVGHTYITYVVHTITYVSKHNAIIFRNIHTVCICSELLVTLSKEKLIKTQLHALFLVRYRLEIIGMRATVLTVDLRQVNE